jgi:hypothetical protein
MNVIDYITITCYIKKNGRLQITSDYMIKCNQLQLITITNYDDPMSANQYIHFDPQIKSNQNVLFKIGTFYNSTT